MSENSHFCTQEGRLSRIEQTALTLDKVVNGNGQEGLLKQTVKLIQLVADMKESSKEMNNNIKDLKVAISGINRFQTVIETTITQREKYKANKRWGIGIMITLILGVAGLVIKILFA